MAAATRNESSHWIFDILELVATAPEPPSAIEIANRLKLPITTTHRGIHTLEQSGYIAQHPMWSRYVLASATKQLTKALLARFAVRGVSLHYLRYVAGASQETTTLCVPLGWYALTVATVLGLNEVADRAPVGSSVELHNSASGLALLAFLPKARLERYLAWVQKHKLGKPAAIRRRLAEIRAQGYALSLSDAEAGGQLAVPIRSIEGEALASIAVQGGSLAVKSNRPKVLATVVAAARRIEGVIQLEPERFRNPYDHLPPDEIRLPRGPARN
ncbi:IclR family transcriptional regulator C-terminal domain-containing protein [Bradyrhizobium sp. LHD-71]|uniref:IclR family transcriptional regulator n=1 Tax=Bradyrhizobium sp. LHD-71 TaxID=3072141 RepID=UPI00280E9FA2|nr:IclR family transcriptional regulator C-terminal domain-containing protein [Bradyrhizobium sp. LHD-71]MDQ8729339.1 IclR family transcriptional regulator C-terminal domain-containing protein [Bradyrhizobium sp. LHD-71]